MSELELSPTIGLVIFAFAFSAVVHHVYMSSAVGGARRKYKVPYPTMYAPDGHEHAQIFNCIQRGHQNSLEGWPLHIFLTFITALKLPLFAALTSVVYDVARIFYFQGYSTGVPKKRYKGIYFHFANIAQLLAVVYVGVLFLL